MLREGQNIAPRREVPSEICPYRHSIVQKALEAVGPTQTENCGIKAHLPSGLKLIDCDEAWADALHDAANTVWMHGELSVVVTL